MSLKDVWPSDATRAYTSHASPLPSGTRSLTLAAADACSVDASQVHTLSARPPQKRTGVRVWPGRGEEGAHRFEGSNEIL